MSKRKFYRTVITVEVLSEEPFSFDSLEDVHAAITDGDCSGDWHITTHNEVLDGTAAAKALIAQGSDPSFFRLSEDGENVD